MWEWMIDQATRAVDPDRPMPPPGLDYKRGPFEICREVAREVLEDAHPTRLSLASILDRAEEMGFERPCRETMRKALLTVQGVTRCDVYSGRKLYTIMANRG